jgi:PncC family amidohydrolase
MWRELIMRCGILIELSPKGAREIGVNIGEIGDEYELSKRAGEMLIAAGVTLAVAESCTGGMLGAWLTAVPGSSSYFLGGVIAYADSVKVSLLGVPPGVIREYGAVSAECALAMAHGARKVAETDVGVSITGVAGPGGGTEDKPVGTTYLALVGPSSERVEHKVWHGDRNANREQSARFALQMIIEYLQGSKQQHEGFASLYK